MNSVDAPSFQLIQTAADLKAFAHRIRREKMVGVDLEADSMFHYKEKVCLLQMAGNGENVVIDPLEVNDLSSLAHLFKNRNVCKVLHGSDYDVRCLYRDFSIEINNLFDTQLASMFLGEQETSLGAVVNRRFGVVMDKRYQKKDWSRRPLPVGMIQYAASDAVHLIPLARMLMKELEAKNRLEWVKEECRLLAGVRPMGNGEEPLFLRFRGAGRLQRRNLAILEELLQYRRKLALKKDRPLFKVFSNKSLLTIATEMADTPQALEKAGCLSAKQIRIYGKTIAEVVKQAKAIPANKLPVYPRKRRPTVSPKVPDRIKAIKAWRDRLATELELDPALLFNKALMTAIAVKKPAGIRQLREVDGIRKWQVKDFGKEILKVLTEVP
jgi:ribonuclease D